MIWIWLGFIAIILILLALDLGVFHRHAHRVSTREAALWTSIWVATALLFNVAVYFIYKHNWQGIASLHHEGAWEAAVQFFTGYVIEKSLSVDNIFVIAMVFSYFSVPQEYQHRVLFWGILGALVMRGIMIALGAALINRFEWITYVFGGLLLVTAVKLFVAKLDQPEPEKNPLVRLARKVFPVTAGFEGQNFFVRLHGKRAITPLLLVLLVVETTDVLFAVDSIPAIFAITRDPFLVFTSNVFAILGLRSLYFVLAGAIDRFQHLKTSLVFVLAFVGVKMLISNHAHIPTWISLGVIGGILLLGVIASLMTPPKDEGPLAQLTVEARRIVEPAWRNIRRLVVFVIGATLVAFGIVLIVTPGPAMIVIPLGLAVLGSEFVWARRLLKRIKNRANSLISRGDSGDSGDKTLESR